MTALLACVALTACASGSGGSSVASAPPAPAEPAPSLPRAPEPRPSEPEPRAADVAEPPARAVASELPAEPDCRAAAEGHAGARVASRRLRRYPSDEYETEDIFDDLSVQRAGRRLRVRWWMEERGCPLTTELVRVGDLVVLRQSIDPAARCRTVGATLVETRIRLRESDRRLCVPGHPTPIALDALQRWTAPPVPPPRRAVGMPDPWAVPTE